MTKIRKSVMARIEEMETKLKELEKMVRELKQHQDEQKANASKVLEIFEEEMKKAGFKTTTPVVEKLKGRIKKDKD